MVVALAVLLTLVLLEVLVRILIPQQLIILRPDIWIPVDNGRGYALAPNLNTTINTGQRPVTILTDSNGYRISENKIESDAELEILAVGDSFLQAFQVNYDDTMTAILERELRRIQSTSVRIVNTGVGGYTPNHYRIVVEQEMAENTYDLVIVFVYLGNDFVDGRVDFYNPRESRARNFRMPRSLKMSEIVDSLLYPINEVLERHSHLYVLLKNRFRTLLARMGLTAYSFPASLLSGNSDAEFWDITSDIFADIEYTVSTYNTSTLFVLIPSDVQVLESSLEFRSTAFNVPLDQIDFDLPVRMLVSRLSEANLNIVDTTPFLQLAHRNGFEDLYGSIDAHLGINGHRVVAESVLPVITDIINE